MAFSVNLKSVDGYYIGICKPCTTLVDAQWQNVPPESTTSLVPIVFQIPFEGGESYWIEKYQSCCMMNGMLNSVSDFITHLRSQGYTSINNLCLVCAFDVVDSGQSIGKQVVVMAYADATNFFRYQAGVRTRTQSGWTYTGLTSWNDVMNTQAYGFGLAAGTFFRNSKTYYCFGFLSARQIRQGYVTGGGILYGGSGTTITSVLGGEIPGDATSPEFGPASKPGGGYNQDTPSSGKGSFDDSSDTITPSSKPTLTPLSSNLVHAYKVNTQMLNDIADAIYVDLANDWSSIETALEAIYNAIFAAKYVDYLLDLLILPIDVPAPNLVNVKVGGKYLTLSSGRVQSYLVTDPYVDFDCGSITIPEYWANFLDYTGTKVKLFLPYIGYVDIQPEYIIGGELNVRYRFNVLDGSFIVHVLSTSGKSQLEESMIGQYAGVAAVHVPLQASDYATKVSGLISAIGTVAAGMAAGGVGAMTGAANLGNTLMQKPGSTHANGYNASSSYLSHRCPYLIIERQVSQFSEKYMEEVGLPLNVMRTLGDMSGLTKCESAHLDTIPCSVEGKEKISRLMKDGIIL